MKKIIPVALLFLISFNLINCTDKNEEQIPSELEIQNFIWKALNFNYLWQNEVVDLKDERFTSQQQLSSFLENKEPENLFYDLLTQQDRFSWIVDDYVALQQLLAGVTKNNGMEYGNIKIAENVEQIFGYVRYIIPSSDAANKGVERGQIIYGINGEQLTKTNYKELYKNDSYTVDFGSLTFIDDIPTVIPNGEHILLNKEILAEHPIHKQTINLIEGHKIGYLMYNQFTNEYDSDLNNAFLEFKNENVTDLVLDLRYNGGGSVNTAILLSSMITGQFTDQLYATLKYNEKLNDIYGTINYNFVSQFNNGQNLNHLNLNKVYILVSGSTASASELIINGLKPYIDVQIIGTKTVGKSVASVTLYDSENYRNQNVNPNHNYALQPLVAELKNKLDQNNHVGFEPNTLQPENYANLGILGTINEPLFATAIEQITNTRKPIKTVIQLKNLANSKETFAQNNMFIDLK